MTSHPARSARRTRKSSPNWRRGRSVNWRTPTICNARLTSSANCCQHRLAACRLQPDHCVHPGVLGRRGLLRSLSGARRSQCHRRRCDGRVWDRRSWLPPSGRRCGPHRRDSTATVTIWTCRRPSNRWMKCWLTTSPGPTPSSPSSTCIWNPDTGLVSYIDAGHGIARSPATLR